MAEAFVSPHNLEWVYMMLFCETIPAFPSPGAKPQENLLTITGQRHTVEDMVANRSQHRTMQFTAG